MTWPVWLLIHWIICLWFVNFPVHMLSSNTNVSYKIIMEVSSPFYMIIIWNKIKDHVLCHPGGIFIIAHSLRSGTMGTMANWNITIVSLVTLYDHDVCSKRDQTIKNKNVGFTNVSVRKGPVLERELFWLNMAFTHCHRQMCWSMYFTQSKPKHG